jgi:hypothetical protein
MLTRVGRQLGMLAKYAMRMLLSRLLPCPRSSFFFFHTRAPHTLCLDRASKQASESESESESREGGREGGRKGGREGTSEGARGREGLARMCVKDVC